MSRISAFVVVAVLVTLALPPSEANWFGKRGDKEDLFSLLIQQPHLDRSMTGADWDSDTVLMAVEGIISFWRQQQSDKLAKSNRK